MIEWSEWRNKSWPKLGDYIQVEAEHEQTKEIGVFEGTEFFYFQF